MILTQKTIGVAEMNALESFVLQNHQVEAASQNHQLIGLIAMAIKIRMETWLDFGNQSFITKQGSLKKAIPESWLEH